MTYMVWRKDFKGFLLVVVFWLVECFFFSNLSNCHKSPNIFTTSHTKRMHQRVQIIWENFCGKNLPQIACSQKKWVINKLKFIFWSSDIIKTYNKVVGGWRELHVALVLSELKGDRKPICLWCLYYVLLLSCICPILSLFVASGVEGGFLHPLGWHVVI